MYQSLKRPALFYHDALIYIVLYIVSICVFQIYTWLNKAFLTTFSSRNSLEVKFVLVLVDLVRQIPFLPVFNLTDLKTFN